MTKYINKKTKTVIDVDSVLRGDWVEVGSQNQPLKTEEKPVIEDTAANELLEEIEQPEKPSEESTTEDSEGIADVTRKDIMQELDSMGIEYDNRAKKQVLYDLMMSQGK
ncbi:hypothetical protein [Enterococcus avium]|uniref:hypothetical protein n=1 Tax=Enterococcus avium TaxID=33945 RepID=UPI001C10BC17|nr:hypothetical protein [Enterococcus avium]MBU5370251.1 hypothetical protein [Enterococcus avium]